MHRHTRRYYFCLAERLGMTVTELLSRCDAYELAEWMAFDLTKSEQWQETYKQEQMSAEQRSAAIKKLFGF